MKLSLTDRDQQVIWHPYTQHKDMVPPLGIVRGQGALLYDEKDKDYIDAISSWWVNIHGHAHAYIARRIFEQANLLEHVIFAGFTHEPAVGLAERLLAILPGDFSKIFYSDNGSTAVEVAIKMAIQYWKNKAPAESKDHQEAQGGLRPKYPNKILALKNSYHGDTFGAMSVSDRGIFTSAFNDYLFEVIFMEAPNAQNISNLESEVRKHSSDIACFIYEPLLQAAGGMLMHDPNALDDFLFFLRSQNILCIADEVMTGFGRTGKLFAGSYLTNTPDIICLSKGLTGGHMPLGVTAATKKIFEAFLSDDKTHTFFHGHSFTANPLGCAAALASLDLLEKDDCTQAIGYISARNKEFAEQLQTTNGKLQVKNVRSLGTVLAFEIENGEDGYLSTISAWVTAKALAEGIYLRPLGNTVYVMPPYCISGSQLEQVYSFLLRLIAGA
jgi:adenosylmethionine---8-amino-7-oxononanoate aminotransferase